MPRIPYGEKLTVSVTGSKWKVLHCTNCGSDYVYLVKTTTTGSAENPLWLNRQGAINKAEDRASNNLEKRLNKINKDYPCPTCGHYQPDMIKRMKVTIWQKAIIFGFLAMIGVAWEVGFIVMFTSQFLQFTSTMVIYLSIGSSLFCGIISGLIISGALLSKLINFNPNANASERRNQSFSELYPVLTKADLDRYLSIHG